MSTTDRTRDTGGGPIELLSNEEEGTVTFAAAPQDEITVPATEWITIDADDLVDVRDRQ